jgi:hypothetical protein
MSSTKESEDDKLFRKFRELERQFKDTSTFDASKEYYYGMSIMKDCISKLEASVLAYRKNPSFFKSLNIQEELKKETRHFQHSALFLACMNSRFLSLEPAKMLINAGANINDTFGCQGWYRPIILYIMDYVNTSSTYETIELLIDAGADLTVFDTEDCVTPITFLMSETCRLTKRKELFNKMIEKVDINKPVEIRRHSASLLEYACNIFYFGKNEDLYFAERLLDAGARINVKNSDDGYVNIAHSYEVLMMFVEKRGLKILSLSDVFMHSSNITVLRKFIDELSEEVKILRYVIWLFRNSLFCKTFSTKQPRKTNDILSDYEQLYVSLDTKQYFPINIRKMQNNYISLFNEYDYLTSMKTLAEKKLLPYEMLIVQFIAKFKI